MGKYGKTRKTCFGDSNSPVFFFQKLVAKWGDPPMGLSCFVNDAMRYRSNRNLPCWTVDGGLEHFFIFPYIGNFIISTDFHIFRRDRHTTKQFSLLMGKRSSHRQASVVPKSLGRWIEQEGIDKKLCFPDRETTMHVSTVFNSLILTFDLKHYCLGYSGNVWKCSQAVIGWCVPPYLLVHPPDSLWSWINPMGAHQPRAEFLRDNPSGRQKEMGKKSQHQPGTHGWFLSTKHNWFSYCQQPFGTFKWSNFDRIWNMW